MTAPRDHGGNLDAAMARFGGTAAEWIDLSTGINPLPYPVGEIAPSSWTRLPDRAALQALISAARGLWQVPDAARILAAPGASAIIARLPALRPVGRVHIPGPTYNEHAAAFRAAGWSVLDSGDAPADARVLVHPNNPDGRVFSADSVGAAALTIIDESFCDTMPGASLVGLTARPGTIVLKSFGKFWGLAGLRLGFAIGHPQTMKGDKGAGLDDLLGPWAVSGPAIEIATRALSDAQWAERTRHRLSGEADRLDGLMQGAGARLVGGTTLFRLYRVPDARAWQDHLAAHRIWTRVFPYDPEWIRLGLPGPDGWQRLERALDKAPWR